VIALLPCGTQIRELRGVLGGKEGNRAPIINSALAGLDRYLRVIAKEHHQCEWNLTKLGIPPRPCAFDLSATCQIDAGRDTYSANGWTRLASSLPPKARPRHTIARSSIHQLPRIDQLFSKRAAVHIELQMIETVELPPNCERPSVESLDADTLDMTKGGSYRDIWRAVRLEGIGGVD